MDLLIKSEYAHHFLLMVAIEKNIHLQAEYILLSAEKVILDLNIDDMRQAIEDSQQIKQALTHFYDSLENWFIADETMIDEKTTLIRFWHTMPNQAYDLTKIIMSSYKTCIVK